MTPDWNAENAAHLLRRAGFEAHPKVVAKAVKRGFEKTLSRILKLEKRVPRRPKSVDTLDELGGRWVHEMVRTRRPLRDKITLFWHDHFATGFSKVQDVERMHVHLSTLREHALGRFEDLVLAVARDPAMLVWLDNHLNVAGNPNENFARELMELFTTGVLDQDGQPNYTETDVAEVARAFTGWGIAGDEFLFKEWAHDFGTKTVKGVTGPLDGDDVVRLLVEDPATTRRIPALLFSSLGRPIALDDPIADDLQAVFVETGGDLLAVVEAIFRHEAFWEDATRHALVKSPAEWVVGSLRLLGGKPRRKELDEVGGWMEQLGQTLLDPPSVFGWPTGAGWVQLAGMLARAHVANEIASSRDKDDPLRLKARKSLGKKKNKLDEAAEIVDRVLEALDCGWVAASTRDALAGYVATEASGLVDEDVDVDKDFIDRKVRGLLALVLASPEYQLA